MSWLQSVLIQHADDADEACQALEQPRHAQRLFAPGIVAAIASRELPMTPYCAGL
jgi:hypothetical protein